MKSGQNPLFAATMLFLLTSSVFAGGDDALARENGVLENAQVAFLFLSGMVFAVLSFRVARDIRYILWMGTWFCLSCILRELDVEELALPRWVVLLGSGTGRNLIMACGWLFLGVVAIRSHPERNGMVWRIVRSPTGVLSIAAGVVLLLGSVFDHTSLMAKPDRMFWEEVFETVGYFLLLPASFLSSSIANAHG